MDNLKRMKKQLMSCVQSQMEDLRMADTDELGKAIDMIKDISETMYYCSIVEAMEHSETRNSIPSEYYKDMYPSEMRDMREGRSGIVRKYYMESKELGHEVDKKMKELETYIKELSEDIMEMMEGATHEEKQMLSQKLLALANNM